MILRAITMNRFKPILILLLLGFSACSTNESSPSTSNQDKLATIQSIDLYLSRATFSGAQFEQFKFTNGKLFAECGKIAGGRQTATYQDLRKLSSEDNFAINSKTNTLIAFASSHELKLDEPGKSSSMFDPGQYELKINSSSGSTSIKTSLDAVSTASKTSEENLRVLAKTLRDIAMHHSPSSTLCGNKKFFDLG
jgi:hypothetical protein